MLTKITKYKNNKYCIRQEIINRTTKANEREKTKKIKFWVKKDEEKDEIPKK